MLDWLVLFLQIMLINIVLSGDNAVVIALASKGLPAYQRRQAIWWGAFGAVGLRLVLTVAALFLLKVPFIQAVGSLLLLWIAVKLLSEDGGHAGVAQATSLGNAIRTIIAADFIMSLDNVLAIAAKADGDVTVILVGIALSIPIIIWGSELVVRLLNRFPLLVYVGAGILGFTAGEMFLSDLMMQQLLPLAGAAMRLAIPIGATAFVMTAGLLLRGRASAA